MADVSIWSQLFSLSAVWFHGLGLFGLPLILTWL